MLLEAWQEFESEYGDQASRNAVTNLMPKRVKKRRRIQTQDGVCWNNYFMIFQSLIFKYFLQDGRWLGRIF